MVKRKKSKVSMPSSGAGLIRYMDEEGHGLKLKPEYILFAGLGVVILKLLITFSL